MIALLPLLAGIGLVFVEQPIDNITISRSMTAPEQIELATRVADMDGDGAKDIITTRAVAFQRNGQFPKGQQTPLPIYEELPVADVWNNEIYVLLRDRIDVLRWSSSEWQKTLSQPMAWARSVNEARISANARFKKNSIWFERFLCDLNGDGKPEIVRTAADGIHVFARKDLYFEEAAVWNVLPPMIAQVPARPLWPADARAVELPSLSTGGSFRIQNGVVQITREEPLGGGRVRFTRSYFPFDAGQHYAIAAAPAKTIESEPVDAGCWSIALNEDETLDIGNVRLAGWTSPPLQMAIYEANWSTDSGKSFRSVRSYGAMPGRVLVDYNNDDRLDLVAESKRVVEGGIRETLVRGFTSKEVDLELQVWLQDEKGGFPEKPTFANTFTIQLDKPPANQTNMCLSFLRGELVSLGGDFDGDGLRDAAVQDRPDRVAIHKGTARGFESGVMAATTIPKGSKFRVADVDQDGRADLLIDLRPFVTRDSAP